MDAEALERCLDLFQHPRHRVALERGETRDVVAVVAVLGRLLPPADRLDRCAEALHLGACVVVVVLALDCVAARTREARDGVAVRAVPRRGDRDRPGRVRRDHLHLHALGVLGRATAEAVPSRSRRAPRRRRVASHRLTKPGPATSARSRLGPSRGFGDLLRRPPRAAPRPRAAARRWSRSRRARPRPAARARRRRPAMLGERAASVRPTLEVTASRGAKRSSSASDLVRRADADQDIAHLDRGVRARGGVEPPVPLPQGDHDRAGWCRMRISRMSAQLRAAARTSISSSWRSGPGWRSSRRRGTR